MNHDDDTSLYETRIKFTPKIYVSPSIAGVITTSSKITFGENLLIWFD